MIRTYRFKIHGGAANGQAWHTSGLIADVTNNLHDVFQEAMRETFRQITKGKAVFGHPGLGCAGPYSIQRIVIEQTE